METVPESIAVSRPLSWLHFGDLHLTSDREENYRHLKSLIALANFHLAGAVDFAVLPGDNADDGLREQFALVKAAVKALVIPHHIIPGDHDFKPRSLDAYYQTLSAERLPTALTVAGYRCIFLDAVSAGSGGPDFRLGRGQLDWLERELTAADQVNLASVVFMHVYPADLVGEAKRVCDLFARHQVVAVDMGHTHYNELANDGRTIFMATRSTGQIEEGPVGFSVAAVDGGVVSWRFKELDSSWPLVLITSPADRRLATGRAAARRTVDGFEARALVWSGNSIAMTACAVDDGPWQEMRRSGKADWSRHVVAAPNHAFRLTVRAEDTAGQIGEETIQVAADHEQAPSRRADGSDADALGAWPEKGLLGTQLGPNRNGRKW